MTDRSDARARAETVAEAAWASTTRRAAGSQRTMFGCRMVMTRPPTLAHDEHGQVVGVECHVRCYDAATGAEIPVDPVRRFLNPPTAVSAAHGGTGPLDALWHILWDSVIETPAPDGWRR